MIELTAVGRPRFKC